LIEATILSLKTSRKAKQYVSKGKGYLVMIVGGGLLLERTLAETVAQLSNGCTESSCSVRLPSNL